MKISPNFNDRHTRRSCSHACSSRFLPRDRLVTREQAGNCEGKRRGEENIQAGTKEGKLSFGYEIINAASRTRRTLQVTHISSLLDTPSFHHLSKPSLHRFTSTVSGHNSKSLRCANRVYRRSRWNVRPRASTVIKPHLSSARCH